MIHATAITTCELANLRCEPHHRVIPDSSAPGGEYSASRIKQVAHRSWPDAPCTVEVSNFKSDSPLSEQHTVGVEETELGIVDMRCFRGHAVQLNDFHVAACHEVLPRRNTNVKATEEETVKGLRDAVDDFFQVLE